MSRGEREKKQERQKRFAQVHCELILLSLVPDAVDFLLLSH